MTYSVHQHWDPLRVCAVGRSYPPEFYDYITNKKVRNVFYKIAEETEEDFQKLINFLESFGVQTVRPNNIEDKEKILLYDGKYKSPLMCPRDHTAMIGNTFYMPTPHTAEILLSLIKEGKQYKNIPSDLKDVKNLPHWVKDILTNKVDHSTYYEELEPILKLVETQGNTIEHVFGLFDTPKLPVNTAMISRIGKDLYIGTEAHLKIDNIKQMQSRASAMFPNYRCHIVDTQGHYDSVFCPVVPGLIVSLHDVKNYEETFPGWEVIYLPGQSYNAIEEFCKLKEKNRGKWWVRGEELNDDFTDFVENWMNHWVGYVEETVFDVNMLVIDEKNVLCNNYNQKVFDAFSKRGITAHVINFRHRYFWDGGWHCVTSDLHRDGVQKDYFPERG